MDISDDTGIKYSTLESRYKTCGDIELKERNCILCNKKFMPQKFEQQFCSQECRDKKYGIKINILVKKVREEKSMTLYTLAKLSGISKGHLSKIEREERDPKLVTLIQIAQALEVDVKELYEIVP